MNPQDLCFYQDGRLYFESTAEEKWLRFYPSEEDVDILSAWGFTLEWRDDVEEETLFQYEPKQKW